MIRLPGIRARAVPPRASWLAVVIAWLAMAAGAASAGTTGPDPDAAGGAVDDASLASPRAVVEIGGASVVLVFAHGRLNAFVDRLEDNAPIAEAKVTVQRGAGAPLVLGKVATGLFVSPFDPANRASDELTVTLASSDGSGSASATLRYAAAEPTTAAPSAPGSASLAEKLAIGLLAAAVAGLLVVLVVRRRRHPDRRQTAGRIV